MERRDWSLEALKNLQAVDSLENDERAQAIKRWALKYLNSTDVTDYDLNHNELLKLQELLYKNRNFLVNHSDEVLNRIKDISKLKKFFQN